MSAIAIRGLTKSYGPTSVLTGLDLSVPDGGLTAVLGASGCGKTTLLRLIAGFDAADAGVIELAGRFVEGNGARTPPERRRVGYVAQEGTLFPHLSVGGNVAFGLPRQARRGSRVDDMLELVGLAGFGARGVHELSGGQQQRVALARALAPGPRLVLLDEPFGALDPTLRDRLRGDVRDVLAAVGATALLVTHDQEEAFSIADRVAVLRGGRVAQHGPPEQLYRRPVDAAMAEFLGEANLVAARMEDGRAHTVLGVHGISGTGGHVRSGDVIALIRPEDIRLAAIAPGDDDSAGCATGRVDDVRFFGHDARITVSLADPRMRLVVRTLGAVAPPVNAPVCVSFPEVVHIMSADGRALAVEGATRGARPLGATP